MDKNLAILDIGSGKLAFTVGYKSNSGIFVIKNFADVQYSGYFDKQFVEPERLASDISAVINKSGYRGSLSNVYVGVPTDFLKIENNSIFSSFPREKYITRAMLDQMHEEGNIFGRSSDYVVINSSATEYIVNNTFPTLSPVGTKASDIRANLSYIYCEKSFCELLDSALRQNGCHKAHYISSVQAIANQLIPQEVRQGGAVVVDVGFVNASFGYIKGDGLAYLSSLSVGGGNIADDLAYAMDIDFEDAYDFFGKINLNQDLTPMATYSVVSKGEMLNFGAMEVNEIVTARLDYFCEWIMNELKFMDKPLPINAPIYMTGGSLTSIRGALSYMQKQLERKITVLTADLPQYDQPKYSSTIAMLDMASEINNSQSLFRRIFG